MANDEDLARLRRGVAAWNAWRMHLRIRRARTKDAPRSVMDLSGANLSGANCRDADFSHTDLSGANLNGANLCKADLSGANLSMAKLEGADLRYALFAGANLCKADLSGADLSDAFGLSDADFSEANLSMANLNQQGLGKANRANLVRANLSEADLQGVDLSGANLNGANLREANLSGADLSGTNLHRTNFREANLREANLSGAKLFQAVFADIDLSATKGLETCRHLGPSIIDTRTLQRSGRLPLAFLRGCGLPERLIEYLPSLLEEAYHYYSCFISYSSKDEAFAKRLYADLQNNGVRCWFAPHHLPIGAKTWDMIDEAIRVRDKLLLILSKGAIASDWVEDEVNKAFAEERRRKQTVLFPVRIDEMVMKTDEPWAVKLRDQRHIGDFRRWKDHDAYQKAFDQVLRDLKATPG